APDLADFSLLYVLHAAPRAHTDGRAAVWRDGRRAAAGGAAVGVSLHSAVQASASPERAHADQHATGTDPPAAPRGGTARLLEAIRGAAPGRASHGTGAAGRQAL